MARLWSPERNLNQLSWVLLLDLPFPFRWGLFAKSGQDSKKASITVLEVRSMSHFLSLVAKCSAVLLEKTSNFGSGCFMLALNTQSNESDLKNLNLSSATSKCQTPWKIRSPKDCELSKRGRARLARRLASRGQDIKPVHSSPWKFLNYKELLRGSCQKQQALMFAPKVRWNKTWAVLEKERYDLGIKATFQIRLASV